jgi:hypothetical protein
MWQALKFLAGGYVFILLSYAWVWAIANELGYQAMVEQRRSMDRSDYRAIACLLLAWTLVWGIVCLLHLMF